MVDALTEWMVFQETVLNHIQDYGATISPHDEEPEILEFHDNIKLEKYGKGYILTPDKSHPYYGDKYYKNGWWMPSQNAWFFKKEFVNTKTKLLKEQ